MAEGGDKTRPMVDMNVTPLIDVLLVLIITFMVVTNLTSNGLDTFSPREQEKPGGDHSIVVSIDANRAININATSVTRDHLGAQLEDIFKTRSDRIVFVEGDSTLPFAEVAGVIDICKKAGINKIGLAALRQLRQGL